MIDRRTIILGTTLLPALSLGHFARSNTQIPSISGVQFVRSIDPESVKLSNNYAKQRRLIPEIRAIVESPKAAQDVFNWARKNNIPFALNSGGHCFMGFSQHEQLVIDTRGINSIQVDIGQRHATVGAGVNLEQLSRALGERGFILAHGTHLGVGIAGHTLGGGFGYFSRTDGLLCDQLNWVEMVTATGEIIRASENENADLFWALRGGGGGQLGLVTRFQFRIRPSEKMHHVAIYKPKSVVHTAEALFLWQFAAMNGPRHLALHNQITRRGNGTLFQLIGFSGGDKTQLEKELKTLLRQTGPLEDNAIQTVDVAEWLMTQHAPKYGAQANLLTHSHLHEKPLDPNSVGELLEIIMRNPAGAATPNFEPWGGAISDIDNKATAFAHRENQFVVHVQSNILSENDRSVKTETSEAMRNVLAKGSTGGVYVNYPDLTLQNWAEAYWGDNLPRMKSIKQKWDSKNLFDHAHSVART